MKKQLLLIIGLIITTALFASPVTKDKARENVMSFLYGSNGGGRMFATAGLKKASVKQVELTSGENAYYVYNIGSNEGFVIASGDDCAEPILGYSYEGSFDPENVPENMQAWLDGYAQQIKSLKGRTAASKKMSAEGSRYPYRHTIPAMLTCKWNQDKPYNDMCPNFKDGHGYRPTGCLATAVSQVMYYHKWPQETTPDIPGYSFVDEPALGGNGSERRVEKLPGVKFEWDKMLDEYKYNSPKESCEAVATLMRYAGQAAHMQYCAVASGAYSADIAEALRTYMNYDKGMKYVDREAYSDIQWADIIYNELSNDRPVLYSGTAPGVGGHQFVCDGYEDDFFHFNWGWGGLSDGFFKLDALAPGEQGIGGAGNGMNFSERHHIVIGVQPPVEGTVQPEDTPVIGRMALTKNFDGKFKKNNMGRVNMYINSRFAYNGEKDRTFSVGFAIYDADGNMSMVKEVEKKFEAGFTNPDNDIVGSLSIEKEQLEADGTYYLRPVVKSLSTGEWNVAPKGDKIYFRLDVTGDDVLVTPYPYVNVEITNIHYEGYTYQGAEVTLKADIRNIGEELDGMLYLTHDKKVMTSEGVEIALRVDEKKEVSMKFYPAESGEQSFGFSINGRLFADEVKAMFNEGETSNSSIEFQPAEGFTSEGNYLDIPVEVTNSSDKHGYKGPVRAILFKRTGFNYYEDKSVMVPLEVETSGKATINVHFDDLDFNNSYYLGFAYYYYGREKIYGGVNQNGNPNKVFSKYKIPDALVYYDAAGKMEYKVIAEGETFDIPAEACYVEIPKTVAGRTINKSSNPNCIYKLKKGVSVATLDDCNKINDELSYGIKLSDEYPFYSKIEFPADKADITIKAGERLTALWLPFDPEKASADGVELKRGYSISDIATSDYVLLPMVAEDKNTIYCDFDEGYRGTPCVMLVSEKYVGSKITFSAEYTQLALSGKSVDGIYYDIFSSNQTDEFAEPIYGFDRDSFSTAVKKAAPFRAYLRSSETGVEKVMLSYPQGFDPAGIEDVEGVEEGTADVYTIDGVKVMTVECGSRMLEGLPSGIYIVNGRKYVK